MGLKITISNVAKVYRGGGRVVTALDGVSLQVAEGEFVCVVGPSGCGKSTLLRILAGLVSQTVVLPGALPAIVTGLRLALGTALIVVIAAEFVATQEGIGIQAARAMQGGKFLDPENVAAYKKYTGVRDEVLQAEPPLLYYPDMRIVSSSIIDMEKTFRDAGLADYAAAIPLESMIERRFQREAVKRLGR